MCIDTDHIYFLENCSMVKRQRKVRLRDGGKFYELGGGLTGDFNWEGLKDSYSY